MTDTATTQKLHTVYALKNLVEKEGQQVDYGYLLFINEEKADNFLEFIGVLHKNEKRTSQYQAPAIYEKFQHIDVNEFYYKKVQTSPNFFVKHLDYVTDIC